MEVGKTPEVIVKIADGVFDDVLLEISRASRERWKAVQLKRARNRVEEFSIGDHVVLNENVKPRYLSHERGVVRGKADSRLIIDLDVGRVRKFSGVGLRVPGNCVELANVAPVAEAVADDGLEGKTRDELDAIAAEFGVELSKQLPNKRAVIAAIRASR
jgi:hypothetical protein